MGDTLDPEHGAWCGRLIRQGNEPVLLTLTRRIVQLMLHNRERTTNHG
jgi:hypothetical protein